jgi:hypothetical protein
MLIHPTVERLRALGLTAMADAFIELQNAPDAGELRLKLQLGYRSLNFNYQASGRDLGFNVHMKGPIIAATFRF